MGVRGGVGVGVVCVYVCVEGRGLEVNRRWWGIAQTCEPVSRQKIGPRLAHTSSAWFGTIAMDRR